MRKTIVITAGGTIEKWDSVRVHTNLARGHIGTLLAEEAVQQGFRVIYLHGYFALKPSENEHVECVSFEGIEDLQHKLKFMLHNQNVYSIIMTAAGSDWIVDKITKQDGTLIEGEGKLSSDEPPVMYFKKAPKILPQIKKWDPNVILIGFKLESGISLDELIERAKNRAEHAKAAYMVANFEQSLYNKKAPHYIINRNGEVVVECDSKQHTAESVIKLLK